RFQLSVRNLSDLRREPGILGTPLRPSSGFEESHVTLPRRMRGRGFRSGSVVRRLPPLVRAAYGLFRRRAWSRLSRRCPPPGPCRCRRRSAGLLRPLACTQRQADRHLLEWKQVAEPVQQEPAIALVEQG